MSRYDIDFKKLVAELLPPGHRKTKRITFIYRLLAWFRQLHAEFVLLQTELEHQGKITSQVIIFESYLNDLFGDGITIDVHEITQNRSLVYSSNDNRLGMNVVSSDQLGGGSAIKSYTETSSEYNFSVTVPSALNADLDRMSAIIEKYMMPGADYQLIES